MNNHSSSTASHTDDYINRQVPPLPALGYLRLPQIIGNPQARPPIPALIPVSKSTWWQGVKDGRYPQPVRTLGARITAWRVSDIRALLVSFDEEVADSQGRQ